MIENTSRSFTKFSTDLSPSGTDITAMVRFGSQVTKEPSTNDIYSEYPGGYIKLGELQTLTVSTFKSMYPVRTLGRQQPVTLTARGARTVGGSMVFVQFNKNVFCDIAKMVAAGDYRNNSGDIFFIDDLPEFDIIVQSVTEFGTVARGVVGGVRLVAHGTTFSVNDLMTEETYTYIARYFIPLGFFDERLIEREDSGIKTGFGA